MNKLITIFITAATTILSQSACSMPTEPAPTATPTPTITSTPTATPQPTVAVPKIAPQNQTDLLVHFIDVGQADSILVQNDGENMLIDGGNVADSSLIVSYLRDYNVKTIDYLVCTHAHEDHGGGLNAAVRNFDIETIFAPKTGSDAKFYQKLLDGIYAKGLEITTPEAGYSFTLGDASVQVLGPITESSDDKNNTSIVLKLVDGENSFLFTGDAEREEEQDILNAGYDLSADVLKVGHHGSNSSTTYPFLREVMPSYAVISVGKDNSYGHPTEEVLSRLRDAEAEVHRTDLQGHIVAKSDKQNITFTHKK